ncbi:MAG: hypothetical protein LBM03_00395, partial [Erysipelotrichaceae bacterium]|nr:hypothetical protein [Erysipelotrichaceae bacterium]
MKKKLFFSGAMLLVALSLVACNTTSSSGTSNVDSENLITSSEDPITSSEEPAATAGWTTEEQAIMSSHLEGYVLPFIELNDDAEVVWYEDWGCVSIESATSPLTKVDEYVAILEAEGI